MRHYINLVMTLCEGWQPSQRETFAFMYGGCAALALALHKLTGSPMVALIEPDGENERPVHVMVKTGDRYLDISGLRTYDEILADCHDEHACENTETWSLVSATPKLLNLWIKDGYFDPISRHLSIEAKNVAERLVANT